MASAENERKIEIINTEYQNTETDVTPCFLLTSFDEKKLINREQKLTNKNLICIELIYPNGKTIQLDVKSEDGKGFTVGSFCRKVYDSYGDMSRCNKLDIKNNNPYSKGDAYSHGFYGDIVLYGIHKLDDSHFNPNIVVSDVVKEQKN